MRLLGEKGAILAFNDPLVPMLRLGDNTLKSVELSPAEIAGQDCVLILTDHSSYDFEKIVAAARLAIDTRNATKGLHDFRQQIIKLGAAQSLLSASRDKRWEEEKPLQIGAYVGLMSMTDRRRQTSYADGTTPSALAGFRGSTD